MDGDGVRIRSFFTTPVLDDAGAYTDVAAP